MRKSIYLLLTLWFTCVANSFAYNQQTFSLKFNEKDFSYSYDQNGNLTISTQKFICCYGNDSSEPGLPLIPINIRIPNNCQYKGFSETETNKTLLNNVVVATNPQIIPTNNTNNYSDYSESVNYTKETYPSSKVNFIELSTFDNYTIAKFTICPFTYDATNKKLILSENISIRINLETTSLVAEENMYGGYNTEDIIKANIINNNSSFNNIIKPEFESTNDTTVKYIIITSEYLANSFKPLAIWKKSKGVNSRIVTIEEIKRQYHKEDIQLSIKTFLYDMYKSGLTYALLGGDDTVVPVRGCYGDAMSTPDYNIPTDLYYACFNNNFKWDANSNGIYGELSDNIGMDPSIYVTRIPVRTPIEVEGFVKRTINYEKEPTENGWENNLLSVGNMLWYMSKKDKNQSDSKVKGDKLYEEYISKYWNGTRTSFYDTYTDFPGGKDYALSKAHLQEKLQYGYNFVQEISHGLPLGWGLENDIYSKEEALGLVNNNYTIITTIACQTNAFDNFIDPEGNEAEPCLSECFIRNPHSGVIAYLGCSRNGFEFVNYDNLGPSLQYDGQFYKHLFSPTISNKNFGRIVAAAKLSMTGMCNTKKNSYRWIQFGLNPIGDPEMPIYTTTPERFNKAYVTEGVDNTITITTNIERCTICAMSTNDNGASYYKIFKNVNKATLKKTNTPITICVTKQGYIPFIIKVPINVLDKKQIISCTPNETNNNIEIKTNINNKNNETYSIVISSINGNIRKETKIPTEQCTINEDISQFPKGINIVSLLSNGVLIDSKQFIK